MVSGEILIQEKILPVGQNTESHGIWRAIGLDTGGIWHTPVHGARPVLFLACISDLPKAIKSTLC